MRIRTAFTYSFFLCVLAFSAQNVTIRGRAHSSYSGKVVRLQTMTDFITHLTQNEDQDTVDAQGYFQLSFYSPVTQPVLISIDRVKARMYVQPDYVYGITVPEVDERFDRKNDAELPVTIGIVGADSTELNVLTFSYQEMYEKAFTSSDNRFFSRPVMFRKADSLRKLCERRYSYVKNPYFHSYYEYSIASVNASLSRGENYLISSYIIGKPIQYRHYEYMQFFNTCFSGYLSALASVKKGQSLYQIINVNANYDQLNNFLKEDKFLANDSLRELVMIKNLWDFHYSAEFSPASVEAILSELNIRTKNEEHKRMLGTMFAYFNRMQAGAPAPDFAARTPKGTVGVLNAFKNRWVYLNFFSTRNVESLREMPKIAALKKKYGDKVSFISVCLDDSLSTYLSYLKANPKFDWSIWYNHDKRFSRTAKEQYFVTGTEAYFLINAQGYLAASPAQSPSQGIEYRFNAIFKKPAGNRKTGIR